MLSFCLLFFFKQKTAYEMRISDWSSDVCSSDLCPANDAQALADAIRALKATPTDERAAMGAAACRFYADNYKPDLLSHRLLALLTDGAAAIPEERSEEHTSELQALMGISYAVLCLKKQRKNEPRGGGRGGRRR